MKVHIIAAVFLLCMFRSINVLGQPCANAFGEISTNPLNLDFGSVDVNSSKILSFQILNNSNVTPLNVTQIEPQSSRFQIVDAPAIPFCILQNSSVNIKVEFLPTETETIVSKIIIDSTAGVATVGIEGTGIESDDDDDNEEKELRVNPEFLNFGTVELNSSSSKSFQILNSGKSPLTISKIKSSNSAFEVSSPLFPKNLSPGAELTISVGFAPNKEGNFEAALSIISDAPTANVLVFGSASAPVGQADIKISPQTLAYADMDVGTFKTQIMTISNSGNEDLELTLPSDALLSSTPSGRLKIQPNRNVQVAFKFIADVAGSIHRKYTIVNNDPEESRLQFTITANGRRGMFGFVNSTPRSRIAGNPNKTSAVQLIDFDNDKKEDLYLTGFDGNLMFKNSGSAVFINSTTKNKLGNNGNDARGVSWGDVDNDGDLDVFIANLNAPSTVLKNNGGVFSDQSGSLGIFAADNSPKSQAGIWLDFNRDSRIDLFVVKDGAPNQLFKNIGAFQFANIASSAGVAFKGPGRAAVSADFNNDGFPDIYLVNFQQSNRMYFNTGNETFRDVTASARVGFSGASQQAVTVDYDGDENIDLFVVNNNGSSLLYRNLGNGKFQNVAGSVGLAGPTQGKSASFADFDHDGDCDLILTQTGGDNILFANNNGKFNRVTNVDFSNADDPTSTTVGDIDNDGDVDVVIGDSDGGADSGDSVYQNNGGGNNNWIILILQGSSSNRSAIGAKVIVRTGIILQAGLVTAGNGKNQDSLPLEFGLGSATTADIIILWPNGKQQSLLAVTGNRKLTIAEPAN